MPIGGSNDHQSAYQQRHQNLSGKYCVLSVDPLRTFPMITDLFPSADIQLFKLLLYLVGAVDVDLERTGIAVKCACQTGTCSRQANGNNCHNLHPNDNIKKYSMLQPFSSFSLPFHSFSDFSEFLSQVILLL